MEKIIAEKFCALDLELERIKEAFEKGEEYISSEEE